MNTEYWVLPPGLSLMHVSYGTCLTVKAAAKRYMVRGSHRKIAQRKNSFTRNIASECYQIRISIFVEPFMVLMRAQLLRALYIYSI